MHLYLHIPFCRRACHYCDFHFSTQLSRKSDMTAAMIKELEQRADFVPNRLLDTIYFGGGTPSLLNINELHDIFEAIHRRFSIAPYAEITLEANPDDITPERLEIWKKIGINRLSIGIQTFDPYVLQYLNRIHTAAHALNCVKLAQDAGLSWITIDLMYGIPSEWAYTKPFKKNKVTEWPHTHEIWDRDLEIATQLGVPHISSYCLTIEEKTVFGNWTQKKKLPEVPEDLAPYQFNMLQSRLQTAGYEHYEVSNFALPNQYAQHNTAYWKGKPYLGIGPSAHSFDGKNRMINTANNAKYLQAIQQNESYFEVESLTTEDHFNELLLTGLRTQWGVSVDSLKKVWGDSELPREFQKQLNTFLQSGQIIQDHATLKIPKNQWLFADRIASDLFVISDESA